MDTFLDRLKFLWPHGAKPSDIYNKIEMSASGFNRVWKEGAIPTADYLVKIQEVTGCDLNWLLTGKGLPYLDKARPENAGAFSVSRNSNGITDTMGNPVDLSEFVFVPRYNVAAAAGYGEPVFGEEPLFCLAFRKYWIDNYVTKQPEKLSVITVKGDSMEGVLNHGDSILINHAKTDPRDGLYVLRIGNDLFVKRVQRIPGKLLVTSENPRYAPFEIDLSNTQDDIAIIGRVEWYGRSID